MHPALLAWLPLLAPAPERAPPRCELRGAPTIEGAVVGATKASTAVDARRGETIEVAVVVPGRLDGRAVVFSDRPGHGRVAWADAGCPPLTIRWQRIEPTSEHVTTAPPNHGLAIYANAVVFGPQHGAWIGFDRLEYVARPEPAGDDRWTLELRDARPADPAWLTGRDAADADLGTARLAVGVQLGDGPELRSPVPADGPRGEPTDRVFRYSFRRDDSLVGWMTAWFGVPYVFGSAGVGARSQAERFVGTDCADLIVAAMRRSIRPGLPYSSVGGLVRALKKIAGPLDITRAGGAVDGYAPQSGDILALGYLGAPELPRAWDHIVVLVADRGPDGAADGRLGPDDLVADIGDGRGLKFAPLGEQGDVRVAVLRGR